MVWHEKDAGSTTDEYSKTPGYSDGCSQGWGWGLFGERVEIQWEGAAFGII